MLEGFIKLKGFIKLEGIHKFGGNIVINLVVVKLKYIEIFLFQINGKLVMGIGIQGFNFI